MIVSAFVFLAILLALCIGIVAGDFAWKAIQRRRDRWALLTRDVKVKDSLIQELTLENRMLQVQLNMTQLTLARKQKRGLYLTTNQAG